MRAKPLPLSLLVCPDCRAALSAGGEILRCPVCRAEFGRQEGVWRLWPPSRAAELARNAAAFGDARRAWRQNRLLRALIPPSPVCEARSAGRLARVRESMRGECALNLGSKAAQWGEHVFNVDLVLPAAHSPDEPAVDLLADIARLPFPDASIDGVICTSVLEHVADAGACLREIHRVLKPGGGVYITVPFLFPYHPDPLDRCRWTVEGLRAACKDFREIGAGPCNGPFSALAAIMPSLLGSVFSNFFLCNAIRFTLGWLLWPLKFGDVLAGRSARAQWVAANVYFHGVKN